MATAAVLDIIEGARWREKDGKVIEIVRLAILTGASVEPIGHGSEPTGEGGIRTFETSLLGALNFIGLPAASTVHPLVPGLFLRERLPTALSPTIIQVQLIYRPLTFSIPPPGESSTVSGGTSLEQVTTQKDFDGNDLFVTHQGDKQGGEVSVMVPRGEISFRRIDQCFSPGSITRAFVGKVNNTAPPWDLGAEVRTWLCTDISFDLVDRNLVPPAYDFSFTFRFRPETYDATFHYVTEEGKPPVPLITGGMNPNIKTVALYGEADFANIGI